jgi:hypothetical protein
MLDDMPDLAAHNLRFPPISWLHHVFLSTTDRIEQIRTGSPRVRVGVFDFGLNLLPTVGFANVRHISEEDGTYGGWRGRHPTWPMSRPERDSFILRMLHGS